MRISIINGSPRFKQNISGLLIKEIILELGEEGKNVEEYHLNRRNIDKEKIENISCSDAIIFAFPLYVDSLPALVLEFLVEMEKNQNKIMDGAPTIYCVINNGFFEGRQNHIAIKQMQHWCKKMNFIWGQGIGVGAGEMLPALSKVPLGKGPKKNLGEAIQRLCFNIKNLKTDENILFSPNYFRFLWKFQADLFWILKARDNGLKIRELYKNWNHTT